MRASRSGKRLRATRHALALCGLCGLGCSALIGIEDAHCDSTLPECSGQSSDPNVALCETYCDTVMANCTGEFAVYVGPETCRSVCRVLPPGLLGDEMTNSVECRLHQADLAGILEDPAAHCPAAGPGGDGLCGQNCEGLCSIMLQTCSEYASASDCLDACQSVPDLGGFDLTQTDGNSQQCRLWHASAATQAAVPHCAHAAGGSPCD